MNIVNIIKPSLISLFFLCTLIPLIPITSYDYHNHQRIIQIAFLLITSLLVLTAFLGNKKPTFELSLNNKSSVLYLIFIFSGCLSALMSMEQSFSLLYTFHISLLILIMYYVSTINDKKPVLFIIYALLIAHTSLTLICLLNIIFILSEQQPLNPYIIYSGFINIRFFNQVQVFILPFLVLLLKFKSIQRVVFIVLFLNLLLIFIGQARGALLSFLAFSIFALALKTTLKKQVLIGLVCLTLSCITFYVLDSLNRGGAEILRTSSSGRIDLWFNTLSNLSLKHLFIGNGPGVFEMSLGSSAPFSHPHNSLIEILNEWGLIALICILTVVFTTFRKAITYLKQHKKDIITESLFYSFAIGITYSLFSGVHVMPVSQTLLFIMWGLLLGRVDKKRGQSLTINKYLKALIAILFVFTWYLYLQKAISIYNNIDPDKGYIYGPRFWSVGQRF
ncbi:O-antigen ligase family protein [Pseudoalteromonas sp. SR43-6]|uniref:O-antigen ligase family protein n=1 Tax=unclassified Pseudoalteromonas TaxID=194690 RepID=UPI0015F90E8C|nr:MULTISPECIES: O-antigen ligase family protein [unclassified Pseudoalteromonas]MBB1290224.1 O-antigen ligase family protein [Pseudoalteromonas sp. SR41-5]MBB1375665.1 O-antigen ligase family protein [Pseudoalteromonas sp. SR43-6]MBB1414834.1 O-antigen ligase family protein [Pseudoalteromonas sp. SG43-8]